MSYGFMPSRRHGIHYDLALETLNMLEKVNVKLKNHTEKHFEHSVVSFLESNKNLKENLITQIGEEEVDKIEHSKLFGFRHRPDITIGNDGTAIEIKLINGSQDVRDILGQGLVYRMYYRFVIIFMIDNTSDKRIVEKCENNECQESELLNGLCDNFNVFTVIGPKKRSENLAFKPE